MTPVNRDDTTHPLGPRPGKSDPLLVAARAANVGAKIELDAQRRRQDYVRGNPARVRDLPCDCDARFERLEAALFLVYRMVDDTDDLARLALERLDAA